MAALQSESTTLTQQDAARRIASSLAYYVQRDDLDIPTVLRMYDWVRETQMGDEKSINLPALARRWQEHQRGPNDSEWLMRAFEQS